MTTHVLTGAGSGIGQALARQLADRGDHLVLLVRDEDRRAQVAEEFTSAQVLVADLAQPGTLNGLGREVEGPVHSLVHAAGTVELAGVERLRLAQWQHHLDVNLTSPAVVTREFLPALRAARGSVVFVNSTAGLKASAGWSAYAASKFGLRGLADSLRVEERPYGVRVTTVYPGRTATPMQQRVHEQEERAYHPEEGRAPTTVAGAVRDVLDLPRDGGTEEIVLGPGPR